MDDVLIGPRTVLIEGTGVPVFTPADGSVGVAQVGEIVAVYLDGEDDAHIHVTCSAGEAVARLQAAAPSETVVFAVRRRRGS